MPLQPLNSSTATTAVNTAAQATKKQGAGKAGDNQSSISSSTEGKGFIATILSPIKCAAKAIASFITAVFKKVFCCFFGDSKEVKGLKELQTTLNSMIEAQTAMQQKLRKDGSSDVTAERTQIREGKAKAIEMIAQLPQATKDDLVAAAQVRIEMINDQETEGAAKAAALVNELVDYQDPSKASSFSSAELGPEITAEDFLAAQIMVILNASETTDAK